MKQEFFQAQDLSALRACHKPLSVRGWKFFVFVRRHSIPDSWMRAQSVASLTRIDTLQIALLECHPFGNSCGGNSRPLLALIAQRKPRPWAVQPSAWLADRPIFAIGNVPRVIS